MERRLLFSTRTTYTARQLGCHRVTAPPGGSEARQSEAWLRVIGSRVRKDKSGPQSSPRATTG